MQNNCWSVLLMQKYSKDIIEEIHNLRQDFLEELSKFKHYGRGWTIRNVHVKDTALDMVHLQGV